MKHRRIPFREGSVERMLEYALYPERYPEYGKRKFDAPFAKTFSPYVAFKFQPAVLHGRDIVLHFTSGAFSRTNVAEMIVALNRVLEIYDKKNESIAFSFPSNSHSKGANQ